MFFTTNTFIHLRQSKMQKSKTNSNQTNQQTKKTEPGRHLGAKQNRGCCAIVESYYTEVGSSCGVNKKWVILLSCSYMIAALPLDGAPVCYSGSWQVPAVIHVHTFFQKILLFRACADDKCQKYGQEPERENMKSTFWKWRQTWWENAHLWLGSEEHRSCAPTTTRVGF